MSFSVVCVFRRKLGLTRLDLSNTRISDEDVVRLLSVRLERSVPPLSTTALTFPLFSWRQS